VFAVNEAQKLRAMFEKPGVFFKKFNDEILVGVQKMRPVSLNQDAVFIDLIIHVSADMRPFLDCLNPRLGKHYTEVHDSAGGHERDGSRENPREKTGADAEFGEGGLAIPTDMRMISIKGGRLGFLLS
jgi:hypothetical protein